MLSYLYDRVGLLEGETGVVLLQVLQADLQVELAGTALIRIMTSKNGYSSFLPDYQKKQMSRGLHRQGVLPVSLEKSPEDRGSTPSASS